MARTATSPKVQSDRPDRLAAPFWRHDGYTLRCLARRIAGAAEDLLHTGVNEGQPLCVDLGAGDSPYRQLFEAHGARYVACDIDASAGEDVIPMEIGQPVPLAPESATLVLSFQVLEHVWDLDWYLGEANRLLSRDGTLLLSTHGTWLYHPHPTDYRRWTRDGLVAELEARNFAVEAVVPLVGPLAWTTQFRALGYHSILSRLPVVGGLVSAILCSVMNLRMFLEDAITPGYLKESNAAVYLVTARKLHHQS